MDRLNKKIALITGAGPGARIARRCHEEGATLIINGMRDDAA
jgi:NAD(P)-dependent dehydrogenase (short-subunit alcohol dehydrogenase family)